MSCFDAALELINEAGDVLLCLQLTENEQTKLAMTSLILIIVEVMLSGFQHHHPASSTLLPPPANLFISPPNEYPPSYQPAIYTYHYTHVSSHISCALAPDPAAPIINPISPLHRWCSGCLSSFSILRTTGGYPVCWELTSWPFPNSGLG